jgi:RNA polymerase sigma-70 factor, ECF subfamily
MDLADPDVATLEEHRRELVAYCYRMLGCGFEAEDATQETLLRAWKHGDGFRGEASVRTWLYRIATNVCIDMSRSVQRRARPMDVQPSSAPDPALLGAPLPEATWLTPLPDHRSAPASNDPAALVEHRESVRMALVAALQVLPPRQRAVFVLCELLRWQAAEVAELLGSSVASVNSALQRARGALDRIPHHQRQDATVDDELLRRYVDAFERYDLTSLVSLLHADAVQTMPPFALWLQGADRIATWMVQPGPDECRGSKLLPTSANGCPAFGQYRPDPAGGWRPWAVQVLEVVDGRIATMAFFLDLMAPGKLFASFGLPPRLAGQADPG